MNCVECVIRSVGCGDCAKCNLGCISCVNCSIDKCSIYPKLVIKADTCWLGKCRFGGRGASLYPAEVHTSCPKTISCGGESVASGLLEQEEAKAQKQSSNRGRQQRRRGT